MFKADTPYTLVLFRSWVFFFFFLNSCFGIYDLLMIIFENFALGLKLCPESRSSVSTNVCS